MKTVLEEITYGSKTDHNLKMVLETITILKWFRKRLFQNANLVWKDVTVLISAQRISCRACNGGCFTISLIGLAKLGGRHSV
jgi:hypothetical protein